MLPFGTRSRNCRRISGGASSLVPNAARTGSLISLSGNIAGASSASASAASGCAAIKAKAAAAYAPSASTAQRSMSAGNCVPLATTTRYFAARRSYSLAAFAASPNHRMVCFSLISQLPDAWQHLGAEQLDRAQGLVAKLRRQRTIEDAGTDLVADAR